MGCAYCEAPHVCTQPGIGPLCNRCLLELQAPAEPEQTEGETDQGGG